MYNRTTILISTVAALLALSAITVLAPSIWNKKEKKIEIAHILNTKTLSPIKAKLTKISSSHISRHMVPPPPPYIPGESQILAQNGIEEWNSEMSTPPIPITLANNSATKPNGYSYSKYIYTAQGYSPAQPNFFGRGVTSWTYTK
jgi:hypothetical protein